MLNLKLLLQCVAIEVGSHIMSLNKNFVSSSQKTRCIPKTTLFVLIVLIIVRIALANIIYGQTMRLSFKQVVRSVAIMN